MGTPTTRYYSIDNYILWSNVFTRWIDGGVDVSNQGYDFFGDPTASKLTEDKDFSWHYVQDSNCQYFVGDYTYSIYAKANGRDLLKIVSSRPGVYDVSAVFDLTNASVVQGSGEIEYIGQGWYRCSVSSSVINALTFGIRVMICIEEDGLYTDDYLGDGESGILITQAQFNRGLDVEAYVETYGSPA